MKKSRCTYNPRVAIYALADPRDREDRYYGRTFTPHKRYKEHFHEYGTEAKHKWMKELASVGLQPLLRVLAWVEWFDSARVEAELILRGYEQGKNLVNGKNVSRCREARFILHGDVAYRLGHFIANHPYDRNECAKEAVTQWLDRQGFN